jgi:hypothetical protein
MIEGYPVVRFMAGSTKQPVVMTLQAIGLLDLCIQTMCEPEIRRMDIQCQIVTLMAGYTGIAKLVTTCTPRALACCSTSMLFSPVPRMNVDQRDIPLMTQLTLFTRPTSVVAIHTGGHHWSEAMS